MDDVKPVVAIIGAGALGNVLARRLVESGYRIEAVISRHRARTMTLARRVEAGVGSTSLFDLPPSATLIFCCVPDDALVDVALALSQVRENWTNCTVIHTSGVHTADRMSALAARGASLLSFHPLQTFTRQSTPDAFEGINIALEGEETAIKLGQRLAQEIGARAFVLPAEAKIRYHLASSIASNFFVTLMALVGEVLSDIDIDRQKGASLMRPLVEGTWQNLSRHLPEDVLTGPIARGDKDTVSKHLAAMQEHLPHLVTVYAAMGAEAVRVAVRSGRLNPDDAQQVLDALHDALEPYEDRLF